jgi:putative holliday junction resolvase
MPNKSYLSLDIGAARIGVATADSSVRIAVPYDTIPMREVEFRSDIASLVTALDISTIVIGYPRNQSGEATEQTKYVEAKAAELQDLDADVVFQDESLTSVLAEQRLKVRNEALTKEAIDAEAACIILQDYLEAHT